MQRYEVVRIEWFTNNQILIGVNAEIRVRYNIEFMTHLDTESCKRPAP